MKSVVTLKTSLIQEVEAKLNAQIKMECASSQFYLACASWLDKEGYENAARFMYGQSEEERMHMMKLIKYVNSSGGHAIIPEITDVQNEFDSMRHVFELLLEHEVAVSRSIHNIVDLCMQTRDYGTFQFLQWYVMEQREEEELARRVLDIFKLIGEEGQGLWLIEQEIGKLADAKAAAEADTAE